MCKKLLLTITTLIFATIAIANNGANDLTTDNTINSATHTFIRGFYVGFQPGLAKANEGIGPLNVAINLPNNRYEQGGAGARVTIGWSIWQYFSVEAGWNYLPNNIYFYNNVCSNLKMKAKTNAFDLVAKFILPFDKFSTTLQNFNLYVKGGAAYVNRRFTRTFCSSNRLSSSKSAFRPAYGIGISYIFNPNISMDISLLGFLGKDRMTNAGTTLNNVSSYIPSGRMLLFGVYYKFTNHHE